MAEIPYTIIVCIRTSLQPYVLAQNVFSFRYPFSINIFAMETPETSACYPSVDRTTTPEASVALGVSSNSPCVNGQAQEDTIINEDSLSPTEEVADVISSTEKV